MIRQGSNAVEALLETLKPFLGMQSMIASYHNSHNYLDHHTNRQPFTIDFSSTAFSSSASTVLLPSTGFSHRSATAHAILMWISFAVIFPAGVIMARYFKVSTAAPPYMQPMLLQRM